MDIRENLEYGLLFEIYGPLLTQKQQEVLCCFLKRDIQISEIASATGSTRQAVNDLIKRTLKTLEDYEKKLRAAEKFKKMGQEIRKLEDTAKQNSDIRQLEQIAKNMDKINKI